MPPPQIYTLLLNGGNAVSTYIEPQLLHRMWESLKVQVNHFNDVICMIGALPISFDKGAKAYLADQYTELTGLESLFVRDGTHVQRYYLGPKTKFDPAQLLPENEDGYLIFMPSEHIKLPKNVAAIAIPADAYTKRAKIPRPPNAYIIYRADLQEEVKQQYPGIHNNEISVILGARWRNETPEVRQKYQLLANEVKRKLLEKYPDYRYQPRKAGEKKRRNRAKAASVQGALPSGRALTVPMGSGDLDALQNTEQLAMDGTQGTQGPQITQVTWTAPPVASPQSASGDELVMDWTATVQWLTAQHKDQAQDLGPFVAEEGDPE